MTRFCVVAQVVGHLVVNERKKPILSDSGKLLLLVKMPRSRELVGVSCGGTSATTSVWSLHNRTTTLRSPACDLQQGATLTARWSYSQAN